MDEKLEQLKQQHMDIPIPKELDFIVQKAIKQNRKKIINFKWLSGIAAVAILVTGLNTSPTFAKALSEVPIVGSLAKVLTFKEFKIDEGTYKANIQVPAITNLGSKSLEDSLNSKYLEESKKLYSEFTADMEKIKEQGGAHVGVDSGYKIKTDNDQILSLTRYVVSTSNGLSKFTYDTVDKKNQLLLTLPSLFKDDRYISLISENIKGQMIQQMKEDPTKVYWVEGVPNKVNSYFKTIAKDQSFYINNDGKLVVCFDKYEASPGAMGVLEFIIPTNAVADVLVSNEYIK
ncbi:DUF3298 domain-containing protein [Paenibacillus sp. LMG 31456]|uniref:DUF3298 domain-containing protein n=1 Tax=Paenibacillus foliorum TaxID=2654974 RepID=A0A972GW08_9BACL|nr:DUF3298 and DUF4163 domain-containing protein [Paenibacillus foliorum]NOU97160.1 DUF3298 domain-containing protein [Paenibacillus foliorum]